MVTIRVSFYSPDIITDDIFITLYDKCQVKRYLWAAYAGGINYTGKETFILTDEGDIIEIIE